MCFVTTERCNGSGGLNACGFYLVPFDPNALATGAILRRPEPER